MLAEDSDPSADMDQVMPEIFKKLAKVLCLSTVFQQNVPIVNCYLLIIYCYQTLFTKISSDSDKR